MPYRDNSELPDNVRRVLTSHAQDIYRESFNSAYQQYDKPSKRQDDASREEVAHRVAWSAVKKQYKKGGDEKWHPSSGK